MEEIGGGAHLSLDLHKPSSKVAQKLGYPLPLVAMPRRGIGP